MTPAPIIRPVMWVAILLFAYALPACGRAKSLVPVLDLIVPLNQTERRPSAASFTLADATIAGERHLAIATDAASRITWHVEIPGSAVLKVAIALRPEAWTEVNTGILFRIGIADARAYDELLSRHVDPFHRAEDRRWIPVTVDLGVYGGFKWSLFYHPAHRIWNLIFNTSAAAPGSIDPHPVVPLWGEPSIHRYRNRP
jgi:hypothetical protein